VGIENVSRRQISQAQYINSFITDMQEYYASFNVVELNTSTTMGADNNPAYKLVYTFTSPEWEYGESITIKAIEVGILVNDKVYYITYSAESRNYSDYLPIAQKMVGSFEILRRQ
jgi:eukaryotic-like serine/threonine-protein kinase